MHTEGIPRGPTPPQPPHHPRRTLAAVFALAVAIAGIAVVARAFVGSSRKVAPLASSASSSRHTSPAPVLGGSGLVIAYSATDVRFCGGNSGGVFRQGPPDCAPWIQVVGVDVSRLSTPWTYQGVTWGTAYLAGPFNNGTLRVTAQGPPRPPYRRPQLVHPPCPSPPGGWAIGGPVNPRSGDADEPDPAPLDSYQKRFPSELVSVAWAHPNRRTWVWVIASTDPARTTAALASHYPGELCVIRSKYKLSDIQRVDAKVTALTTNHWADGVMGGGGEGVGADGQALVEVDVIADTPQVRAAIDLASQPAGLVVIVPWLAPASG